MPNWKCAKCNTENRAEGNYCRNCGEPRPGLSQSQTPPTASNSSAGSIRDQSRSMLDEIRGEISSTFKQSRAALDRFSSGLSDLSDISAELPGRKGPLRTGAAFERVTTRDLKIKVRMLPRLNYALAHCGLPLIPSLEIQNSSYEAAQDVMLKIWVATDYGEPWQKTIPSIPPRANCIENNIVIPLTKSRLQQVREAEKANLRIDIYTEGAVQVSETFPIEVLAYNEWYYHPAIPGTMACFVQPNSEAVEKIVSLVRDRLRKEFKDTSLDGYQSGDPKKVMGMLEAFYRVMQQDLQITYINPPPSFERPEVLADGGNTLSQKVFFPEQIYKHRRGTCLDLALLCAACVERMGLNPVCFLIRGHAFFGAYLGEMALQRPAVNDHEIVAKLLSDGVLLPLNSTTFASSTTKGFAECRKEGLYYAGNPELFMCAVDVFSARYHGFKPIPPMATGSEPGFYRETP